ncbi:hypothetical protein HanXRQr2_Chr13g0572811 [Helianthus annuus]|uniref:Uncharacterized protein n=1 Tax=Helianthus annuus TaxID=4232 RepID=A0A251U5H4_HELAN|nr:hypothetical protein HanXRQr2_Chr13g0572811 [Helianthus annuus]KAJ0904211.1 hypothetical protein HanPSC8_Chr07g0279381 [Helianthus annuus]
MKLKHGHPSNRISTCRSLHSTWILDCLILELRIWHGLAGFPAAFRFRVIRGSRLMALSWTSHGP